MPNTILGAPALALALALAATASPAFAANARHPYSNVDRRVDKGGDTGDSRVEALNQQQLDAARAASGAVVANPNIGAPLMQPMVPMPGTAR